MAGLYAMHGVNLTTFQIKKMIDASKKEREVNLRIPFSSLHGEHRLPLTTRQFNKISKSKSGVDLTLSATQIKHLEKNGGFLPLLALIPAVMGGIGAAGGLAGGLASAVNAAKDANATVLAQNEKQNVIIELLKSN